MDESFRLNTAEDLENWNLHASLHVTGPETCSFMQALVLGNMKTGPGVLCDIAVMGPEQNRWLAASLSPLWSLSEPPQVSHLYLSWGGITIFLLADWALL